MKVLIQHSPAGQEAAIAGLDRAIESLMPHTGFRDAGRTVYMLAVAGKLRPDDEDAIRKIVDDHTDTNCYLARAVVG